MTGPNIKKGVDSIAKSIDSDDESFHETNNNFDPKLLFIRLTAAVATLGSGISLGPEGSAVEIGTGLSRIICGNDATLKEKHRLFLCGTSAAIAAGFNAPIAGVMFAIECGNRYLAKNTVKLLQVDTPDGPRSDIAAIVLSATLANLIVDLGLHEQDAFTIQGNSYALSSPFYELTLYIGLGIASGFISVIFIKLRDFFIELFAGTQKWSQNLIFSTIPYYLQPIFGGLLCGITAITHKHYLSVMQH